MSLNAMDILRFDRYDVRAAIKIISKSLSSLILGSAPPSARVMGTKPQVEAFIAALAGEARYMRSLMDNGLNDPNTYRFKTKLDTSIRKFERETGLKWPIQ